ncbi:MAG: GNAT family N-acetyltransferase [Clostridia bacterium]|nr:GNAT family N-acetyltransferase [Clostridia bacterium]
MIILRDGNVSLRKFCLEDIPKKVEWINNTDNNKYLHYDLPLEYDKTTMWFHRIKDLDTRFDAVIEYEGIPVGLIGLLNIDNKNKKAEYYVCIGEQEFKGCGIAKKASMLLINYAFNTLGLNKIFLYTEEENISAQNLFEKLGFQKEGLIRQDLICDGKKVNRYVYGILKEVYENVV